jgi:hypothetical protein
VAENVQRVFATSAVLPYGSTPSLLKQERKLYSISFGYDAGWAIKMQAILASVHPSDHLAINLVVYFVAGVTFCSVAFNQLLRGVWQFSL